MQALDRTGRVARLVRDREADPVGLQEGVTGYHRDPEGRGEVPSEVLDRIGMRRLRNRTDPMREPATQPGLHVHERVVALIDERFDAKLPEPLPREDTAALGRDRDTLTPRVQTGFAVLMPRTVVERERHRLPEHVREHGVRRDRAQHAREGPRGGREVRAAHVARSDGLGEPIHDGDDRPRRGRQFHQETPQVVPRRVQDVVVEDGLVHEVEEHLPNTAPSGMLDQRVQLALLVVGTGRVVRRGDDHPDDRPPLVLRAGDAHIDPVRRQPEAGPGVPGSAEDVHAVDVRTVQVRKPRRGGRDQVATDGAGRHDGRLTPLLETVPTAIHHDDVIRRDPGLATEPVVVDEHGLAELPRPIRRAVLRGLHGRQVVVERLRELLARETGQALSTVSLRSVENRLARMRQLVVREPLPDHEHPRGRNTPTVEEHVRHLVPRVVERSGFPVPFFKFCFHRLSFLLRMAAVKITVAKQRV